MQEALSPAAGLIESEGQTAPAVCAGEVFQPADLEHVRILGILRQDEPGAAAKVAVRDAYAAAFTSTPLQTRYPRDPDAVGVEFGFHEDYFPSFTGPDIYGFPAADDSGVRQEMVASSRTRMFVARRPSKVTVAQSTVTTRPS